MSEDLKIGPQHLIRITDSLETAREELTYLLRDVRSSEQEKANARKTMTQLEVMHHLLLRRRLKEDQAAARS